MYTIRFYPRGAGSAPAVIISARNGDEIMRWLIARYPEAENIRFDMRDDAVQVYFDLPQQPQPA